VDEAGQCWARWSEILETGANDVYLVKTPDGKEILLPADRRSHLEVDLERGEMRVRPPEWHPGTNAGRAVWIQKHIGLAFQPGKGHWRSPPKGSAGLFGRWRPPGRPREGLRAAGLPPKGLKICCVSRREHSWKKIWEKRSRRMGMQVLTWEDAIPGACVRSTSRPPVLYVRGRLSQEDEWSVAVVGTRGLPAYGRRSPKNWRHFLAAQGITVVSGLARGVDRIAHEAALKAGGRTIAVLGSGVDRIYPPEHRKAGRAHDLSRGR
jgi:hypothetical protein